MLLPDARDSLARMMTRKRRRVFIKKHQKECIVKGKELLLFILLSITNKKKEKEKKKERKRKEKCSPRETILYYLLYYIYSY